ncbi:sensor histidine kinase [Arcticibacter tournemirensis]|uniref:histidine kinase n=1 Tax=Arcticibacter tournemirensis TaxID=699437 RepID=A0A4Q0M958_9SPHI|nr:HAMP domain-containing sensor histidine kinase [Arcticibacter tournemirensis]RXF69730.1 HAMP domain-containing histidine kinase [Arcticibacter tournemirensis]
MLRIQWKIIFRVLLLFVFVSAVSWVIVKGWYSYLFLLIPVVIYIIYDLCRSQLQVYNEINDFVEAVHYRDFSRNFDIRHAPSNLKPLRKGFNSINSILKQISREKETQYQYLQQILEMIETGIVSYEEGEGEILWMNESLKKMLRLPYLKTIHSLLKRDGHLYDEILTLAPGESRIVSIHPEAASFKILLSATAFQTEGRKFKLIAFQNINEALDETEAKAWQKLLSVLTHEIMNSVAPISSLADTLKNRLEGSVSNPAEDPCTTDDIRVGIEAIKRRSEGLLKFAETYRTLNKITTLNLKTIYVRDLFENLYQLMQPTLDNKNIEMDIILKDPGLQVEADTNLIEQVLINLVVNAIDAVKERPNPLISLSGSLSTGKKTTIQVADNGCGISPEIQEQIFVPFFSTKKTGSGIGLSLCKQIMLLHKGNIQVQSREGEGSVFLLQF